MRVVVVLCGLVAACAAPPPLACPIQAATPAAFVRAATPVAPKADKIDAEHRRAEDAALRYVASPAPDPTVIRGVREHERAIRSAQTQPEKRKAVSAFRAFLAERDIF